MNKPTQTELDLMIRLSIWFSNNRLKAVYVYGQTYQNRIRSVESSYVS